MAVSPFTGTQQVYKHLGEAWTAQVILPAMKRDVAAAWVAALTSLGGVYGTMKLPVYGNESPQGVGTGSPQAASVGGDNQHTIWSSGWTPGQNPILKAGDYVTINDQLLQVMANCASDGSGDAAFDVWPRFRGSLGGSPSIIVNNPYGLFRLAGNTLSFELNASLIYGLSFSAMQAF